MTFAEDDHVVQALPPDRADESLCIRILPRRPWRRRMVTDAHCPEPLPDDFAIGCVPVPDQVSRRVVPWERLGDLPGDPFRGGMGGDAE